MVANTYNASVQETEAGGATRVPGLTWDSPLHVVNITG